MHRLPQFAAGWATPDPRAMSLLARPGLAHFRSITSSRNPDTATAETIAIMCRHITDAARDPVVQAAARDAQRRFRGGPAPSANPEINAACSDYWWAKHALRFVHHEHLIRQWLNESDQLQLLIPPEVVLRMRDPQGDCAVYSMLLCAMLVCQGVAYELVTVAADPSEPAIFTHVYARAVIGSGHRLPLDASHGDYPGWQVPSAHISRMQVWNAQGEPVADEGDRFAGLHGYRARRSGLRGWRRRGLGTWVCPDPTNADTCYDDGTTATTPPATTGSTTLNFPWMTQPTTPPYTPAPVNVPPSTPSPWAALAANLGSAWTKIAGNVIAPQTTLVRGPGGQLYYSTPAGSAGAGTSLLGTTTGLSGSTLLIIAVVVGGVLLASKK